MEGWRTMPVFECLSRLGSRVRAPQQTGSRFRGEDRHEMEVGWYLNTGTLGESIALGVTDGRE